MSSVRVVTTHQELLDAARNLEVAKIRVAADLDGLPSFALSPGATLSGDGNVSLRFAPGQDGIQLGGRNRLAGLTLRADPVARVLFNGDGEGSMESLDLEALRVTGCVRLVAVGATVGGHVSVRGIAIEEADARTFVDRPSGFGVEVVPAVFTLWNRQPDPRSMVSAELLGISAGRAGAPVSGSAVFVGGTPGGGKTVVTRLETGEIHSCGGIAARTADRISGGVFIVHGAYVDEVRNRGPVTTYGPNDMVLDNWGSVERWVADAKITSHGPSGIGFVNFGTLGVLRLEAAIETFGLGARGFNVYDGTLRDAEFDRVVTHGDGAVGIQISRPVGRITVRRGVETFGRSGDSLVKGVVTRLPATALSIKPGATVREISVEGGVVSHGEGVDAFELRGRVEHLHVSGGLGPQGHGFESI